MAFLGFLKKDKREKESQIEELIPPPPKPNIDEIPSFQFEKEELFPPIKPMGQEITPLVKEVPEEEEKKIIPEFDKGFGENFAPKQIMQKPKIAKPVQTQQFQTLFPIKEREEIILEESPLERQIKPEVKPQFPNIIKPLKQTVSQHDVEIIEGIPYVRAYKFKEIMDDINFIARNLKRSPVKIKSKAADEAYQNFDRLLDTIMKKLYDIERGVFD